MRKLAIALAVIVALLILAAGVILHSFDAERQHGILSSRLAAALGRNVKLGHLGLSLFPPSLQVRDAEIAEALGFKDAVFSTAKSFQMGVRLVPLLHGRIEVPSIVLEQPVIHLVKNAQGQWNFASLGAGPAAAQAGPPAPGPSPGASVPPLEIAEIRLKDGTITVDDFQKNLPRVTLDHISVAVTKFAPDRAFDWAVSVHPPGPESGEVRANGRGGPLAKQNLAASPVEGRAVFRNVALEALAPFTGQPGLAGVFNGEADFKSDGAKAEAKGTYKAEKLRLAVNGGTALAPVSGRFEVTMPEDASRLLIRRFELACGKAAAQLSGHVAFGSRPDTELRADLRDAPLADIAKLFPLFGVRLPAGSSLTAGTLTAAVRAFGPTAALKESGTVEIRNARLSGYNVAGQLAKAVRVMGIDTGGRDTAIESMRVAFDADPSYTRVPSASLVIPGMEISGQGGFNPAGALDGRGSVVLTRAASPVGSLLQKATGSANTVPFRVGGTLEHPTFLPDVGKIVSQQLGQPSSPAGKLLEGLGGLFRKKK
ncbi:MAG: AsmA family protein [Acidobacteria bacterium]|nr:AsmA family protein [Acidobacteriota bacterium]